MDQALQNTIIADKYMEYRLTLKSFLKINLNMEKIVIKYHFRIFYIPKDRLLVIFAIVVDMFVQIKENAMDINFWNL